MLGRYVNIGENDLSINQLSTYELLPTSAREFLPAAHVTAVYPVVLFSNLTDVFANRPILSLG